MKSVSMVAAQSTGPLVFFREVMKIRRGVVMDWGWPEWDRFFAVAEEHVCRVHEPSPGDNANAYLPAYPGLMRSLLNTWRSAKAAREAGLSTAQWRHDEIRRIDGIIADDKARQERYAQERKDAQTRADEAKRSTSSYMPEIKGRNL